MLMVYIIAWTLIFDLGQYGHVDGRFKKRFFDREKAVEFIANRPDSSFFMTFDSTKIDTGVDTITEIIMLNYKRQK